MENWISVLDELPPVGVPVLVIVKTHCFTDLPYYYRIDKLNKNKNWVKEWVSGSYFNGTPTHWMRLPVPPTEIEVESDKS